MAGHDELDQALDADRDQRPWPTPHQVRVLVTRGGGWTAYYATCRTCDWSSERTGYRDHAERAAQRHRLAYG